LPAKKHTSLSGVRIEGEKSILLIPAVGAAAAAVADAAAVVAAGGGEQGREGFEPRYVRASVLPE
jgi:hypothetical protein